MNATATLAKPPLLIKLPIDLKDFLSEQGYIPSNIFENRSAARLRVRCESSFSLLNSPPFIDRPEKNFQVLIKDLSKCGIGILTHFQVYPLETFCVELMGKKIRASAVRCRKLGTDCYEVGAVILY